MTRGLFDAMVRYCFDIHWLMPPKPTLLQVLLEETNITFAVKDHESKELYPAKNDFDFDFDISPDNVRRSPLEPVENQIEKTCADHSRGEPAEYLSGNNSGLEADPSHATTNLQERPEGITPNAELSSPHTACSLLRVKREHISDLIVNARTERFPILASFPLKHRDSYEILIYSCDLDQHVTLGSDVQRTSVSSYRLGLHALLTRIYGDKNVTTQNVAMTFYCNRLGAMSLAMTIGSLFRPPKAFILDSQLFQRRRCSYYRKASISS